MHVNLVTMHANLDTMHVTEYSLISWLLAQRSWGGCQAADLITTFKTDFSNSWAALVAKQKIEITRLCLIQPV